MKKKARIPLSPEQENTVRSQIFDAEQPGSILHDFELVLEYVGEKGVTAGGKHHLLPMAAIPELDPRLHRPLNLKQQRPKLKSHPYLQGLHWLLRSTGLARVEGSGKTARLILNGPVLTSWRQLEPTERYFNLLEAWLLVASPDMLGESGFSGQVATDLVRFICYLRENRGRMSLEQIVDSIWIFRDESCSISLMDMFGLITLTTPIPGGRYVNCPPVTVTPFGDALFLLLEQALDGIDVDDEEQTVEWGRLQPILQPYFPKWQKNLASPSVETVGEGVLFFKVSLSKSVWRVIALRHDQTAEQLVGAILDSMDFDNDHLYSLKYEDPLGRTVEIVHPYMDEGIPAQDVELGKLPLRPGDAMPLHYDFGDDWHFTVEFLRVEPAGKRKKLPAVVETHGKAPEQYPTWE